MLNRSQTRIINGATAVNFTVLHSEQPKRKIGRAPILLIAQQFVDVHVDALQHVYVGSVLGQCNGVPLVMNGTVTH